MKPSVELLGITAPQVDYLEEPLDIIEYSGRWDYGPKSISKMGDKGIIKRWIESGHESMLEMVDVTFLITCSRVVSHELVRHRIASYQQESQRYVRYEDEPEEDLFFIPDEITGFKNRTLYLRHMTRSLALYRALKKDGIKGQFARYVLPNATRTRVVVKMNLREWRHVLRLRCHVSAQPEMRAVMLKVLGILYTRFPDVFEDVKRDIEESIRPAR